MHNTSTLFAPLFYSTINYAVYKDKHTIKKNNNNKKSRKNKRKHPRKNEKNTRNPKKKVHLKTTENTQNKMFLYGVQDLCRYFVDDTNPD